MLLSLPAEILHLILSNLERYDLKRVCEVSKALRSVATPFLYHSLTIWLARERDEYQSERLLRVLHSFLNIPPDQPNPLQFVRSLEFLPVARDRTLGCASFNVHAETPPDPAFPLPAPYRIGQSFRQEFWEFDAGIGCILRLLKEDHLQKLRWNLGICTPKIPLNLYLATKQKRIEEIWLKTDPGCAHALPHDGYFPLTAFKALRLLSWTGITVQQRLTALRYWFLSDLRHIAVLELGFRSWKDSVALRPLLDQGAPAPSTAYCCFCLLDLEPGTRRCKFPSLLNLKLECVLYHRGLEVECAYSMNFHELKRLSLWRCPCVTQLLKELVANNFPIQLNFFELCDRSTGDSQVDIDVLVGFLRSFCGLETLCLFLDHQSRGFAQCVQAIVHHADTLKSLVYDVESLYRSKLTASKPSFIKAFIQCPLEVLFGNPKLERLALFSSVIYLRRHKLSQLPGAKSLRFLYVREFHSVLGDRFNLLLARKAGQLNDSSFPGARLRRGIEPSSMCHYGDRTRREFVQWAFGPEGFPALEVIAVGDFSRRKPKGFLFGRNASSQRLDEQGSPERTTLFGNTINDDSNAVRWQHQKYSLLFFKGGFWCIYVSLFTIKRGFMVRCSGSGAIWDIKYWAPLTIRLPKPKA
ncbi:uncharacterized protein PADG_05389 [Paracoccidioides brasiliensis Pb18]|uniref:F-box domain-containing protein n=2 Tax=Paracoccidioides brasiliensis TaxID=121759 RepID=C1GDQ3_PARBD|nr:uncharacterized protein PADG_05389 [Paracoccidioides brasiliensis Pb18]EEH49310.2 hypothetical protein PADG_05389 [Paracoccidioides brasiliensis Pb18]ODH44785.1 hypothetical protein ACO22_00686 [Paracoccidioides brasiliensis]